MNTRDIVLISLFAAIIAVLGLLPKIELAVIPVPITAQTMGVMLAGAILGPKRGALAALIIFVLVACGVPVLSGFRGGMGVLAGPSGGFIFGWIFGAFVTGMIVNIFVGSSRVDLKAYIMIFVACILGGIVVVYGFGIIWISKDMDGGIMQAYKGLLVFVPGDLIKAVFATIIAIGVRRVYPITLK